MFLVCFWQFQLVSSWFLFPLSTPSVPPHPLTTGCSNTDEQEGAAYCFTNSSAHRTWLVPRKSWKVHPLTQRNLLWEGSYSGGQLLHCPPRTSALRRSEDLLLSSMDTLRTCGEQFSSAERLRLVAYLWKCCLRKCFNRVFCFWGTQESSEPRDFLAASAELLFKCNCLYSPSPSRLETIPSRCASVVSHSVS